MGTVTMDGQIMQPNWKRYLPLILIGTGAVVAFVVFRDYLSFSALAEHYETLIAWRDQHFALTVAAFVTVYILAVAFSLPGAVWLSIAGGFMFGVVLGSLLVVISATTGAMVIFLAARTALGDTLRRSAGGWLARMEAGFQRGEISYLLIMRLVPVVPFFVANIAPAFLGARTWTFAWTTLVGIIPGTVVYISLGAGLGEQLSRGEAPDLSVIFEWHVLGPLMGLAALASLPLVLRGRGSGGREIE